MGSGALAAKWPPKSCSALYVWLSLGLYLCACVCVCACVFECASVCVEVCVRYSVYLGVCLCVYGCVCMCVLVFVWMCVCVLMHFLMWASVCVRRQVRALMCAWSSSDTFFSLFFSKQTSAHVYCFIVVVVDVTAVGAPTTLWSFFLFFILCPLQVQLCVSAALSTAAPRARPPWWASTRCRCSGRPCPTAMRSSAACWRPGLWPRTSSSDGERRSGWEVQTLQHPHLIMPSAGKNQKRGNPGDGRLFWLWGIKYRESRMQLFKHLRPQEVKRV